MARTPADQPPMSDDLVHFNEPLVAIAGHSKTDLTCTYMNAGDRVQWISDQLELKTEQRPLESVSVVELEMMLALSADDSTRFDWRNAHSVRGWVSTPLRLLDLVRLVGTSHEWTYVVVNDLRHDDNAYAQCTGSSDTGYVVEIGIRDHCYVVARVGEVPTPPIDVGTHGWPYWACDDELHEDKVATLLLWDWLSARISPDGRDLRRAGWRLPPGARL